MSTALCMGLARPVLAWTLASATAGPSRELNAAVERAETHFIAEEYDAASQAFTEAYAIDPDPKYLYAAAQAERLHGDCEAAIDLYERFLDTQPPDPAATEAAMNRDRCVEETRTAPPPPAPVPDTHPPDDATTSSPPWHRDPWGYALAGTGAVSVAIGAGLWGIAIANDREAPEFRTEDEFLDAKSKARTRHRTGIAVTSIGGALLIAGAVRFILLAKRRPRKTTASMTFDRTGVGFAVAGRF